MSHIYYSSGLRLKVIRKFQRFFDYLDKPIFLKARMKNVNLSFLEEIIEIQKQFNFFPEVAIDVGANRGDFTKAIKFLFPHIYVYAFEPISRLFDELENMYENDKAVQIYPYALSDNESEKDFLEMEFNTLSSLLEPDSDLKNLFGVRSNYHKIRVKTKKMDNVLGKKHLKHGILKIDVQGAELQVLKGSTKTLDSIQFIILEYNFDKFYKKQANLLELLNFLVQKGFFRFYQLDKVIVENRISWCDFVFMRDEQ